ncbi:hypothetical protein ABK01_10490 [Treponema sp. OMZ 305]|uniref:hypothetical protein n=1 Tax=Treponema TaxID=157 RepID=UPI001BB054A7|nr:MULTISPECIES: hypothetical protein [Treponema]QUY18751.1 hypothetical protein GWP40_11105 [Treponema vincentii]UTC58642.1 hypothetical protein ABK01_10490 [Treponema sp. OMZ 305]
MNNTKGDSDFLFALDYILNKANIREIDAFAAAIERRQGQLEGALNGNFPFTPEEAAKKMSESIYASIDASMDGVRHTFRNYATDILQKEAPELSKDQIVDLVDSWIPQSSSQRGKSRRASLAKNGSVQGVPADLLYEMVIQFVSYSLGEMPVDTQRSLTAAMHDWTGSYWRRFPTGIKQEIKAFLNGETTSGEFQGHLREMLGLA